MSARQGQSMPPSGAETRIEGTAIDRRAPTGTAAVRPAPSAIRLAGVKAIEALAVWLGPSPLPVAPAAEILYADPVSFDLGQAVLACKSMRCRHLRDAGGSPGKKWSSATGRQRQGGTL